MTNINNKKYFDDTIKINNVMNNNSEDVITIYSKNLHSKITDENYSYKVTPDGRILFNTFLDNINDNYFRDKYPKNLMVDELLKFGFEKIPESLSAEDIKYILQFSISKIEKNLTCAKVYPFSAKVNENGDLEIILLMYNGNSITVALENLPFKLIDANDKVIVAGEIDLDKTVNPYKIGIFNLNIKKENIIEKDMDLTSWNISYER